jgi:hypothetical protein
MEDIKQYGDLTEKELFEFLDEIKSDDEDIQEAQSEAIEKITLEEEHVELSEEEQENREIEARYGDKMPWTGLGPNNCRGVKLFGPEGQRRAAIASIEAKRKKSQRLKEDRIRIQREAFRQEYIRLSDPIGNERIKLLVSSLVKEHTRMVDKYSTYINKRLTTLLNPFIPRRLRICKSLYPDSIRPCPGFLYKASEEYGAGLTFWAMPSIPYYFAQNTEQKVLMEHKSPFLVNVDQSIKFYHEHLKQRANKELKYASLIYQKGIYSYFDLLRLNPFWYEVLYNDLQNKIKEMV